MSSDKGQVPKAVTDFQSRVSSKRAEDAMRAGLAPNYEEPHIPKGKSKKHSSVGESVKSDEEDKYTAGMGNRGSRATRVSDPARGIDFTYHEPIKVRFNSKSGETKPKG